MRKVLPPEEDENKNKNKNENKREDSRKRQHSLNEQIVPILPQHIPDVEDDD